ncbi:MAG: septum formation initiator family protein [Bacteroidetes bacterium]|nr:septum formation initiator family protein [Bacteroidota bacterium]MBS1739704.1 septum formation initiator family protein [Bacteroidota bacterium]
MRKVFQILTNKFLIVGVAFVVWIVYFDQNCWMAQEAQKKEIQTVNRNIAYLQNEIARMEKEYRELKTNPQRVEQYARERYKMKKDNEDVFLIER